MATADLIPLRNDLPYFSLTVPLDGVTYLLEFRWRPSWSAWFMRIYDAEGVNVIVGDTRVVVSFPLAAYVSTREPRGMFMAIDTSGQNLDPGLTDLGQRVILLYVPVAALGG